MQEVIHQLANQYKILLFLEEEENRNFRCAVKLKDNVINVAGKMKLQQELRSLAIWMSWFPWILGMLILQQCLE
jgi:hypothetical protein